MKYSVTLDLDEKERELLNMAARKNGKMPTAYLNGLLNECIGAVLVTELEGLRRRDILNEVEQEELEKDPPKKHKFFSK